MRRPPSPSFARLALSTILSATLGCGPLPALRAGDLLRGGAAAGAAPVAGSGTSSASGGTTGVTRTNAVDRLARTTQALQAARALQAAARAAAANGTASLGQDPLHPAVTLPVVPDGLGLGGLQVASGVPKNLAKPGAGEDASLWQGAKLPTQTTSGGQTTVTVKQTAQQALLTWETFNIGRQTTLQFDQSAGGADVGQWIAFNKINDPNGRPSQILGAIKAAGQVYVINQNGIIFGGTSQVNVHALVASALPINENLVKRGLLNNPDAQFLFSALAQPAGSQGTDAFTPPDAPEDGIYGDVIVQAGAQLTAPTSADHVGGRIALVGANVSNAGTISTADGQTILAAGLQVGFTAHASSDPSLRGLDVFIGAVADPASTSAAYAGTAVNTGLIDAPRANVTIAGRTVEQDGVIDSSTSVSLNGRIDLLADYGAVRNQAYNATTNATAPLFVPVSTGTVTLGAGSVSQILPEWDSTDRVVGTSLALPSLVNIRGQAIHLAENATILAPGAQRTTVTATDGTTTTVSASNTGGKLESGVTLAAGGWLLTGTGAEMQDVFSFSDGQIYLDDGAAIDVAGSQGVQASVSENIVAVQLLGSELANSPLQRDGALRGQTVYVDIRRTGTYDGKSWIGTPLADASGYAALVQRTVGELTTAGGSVDLSAGGSVVVQSGAKIDVSGGWIDYQGGTVATTKVVSGGHVFDISQATPDRVYSGIYTGSTQRLDSKWGITSYSNGAQLFSEYEAGYTEGGSGGSLAITAPAMALDGTLTGTTVTGSRQRAALPAAASLSLVFQRLNTNSAVKPADAPTPPAIVFQATSPQAAADPFALGADGRPLALRADRTEQVYLSPDLVGAAGFGRVTIDNADGDVTVPAGVTLATTPGGSIALAAANLDIEGRLSAPGGSLTLNAYDVSPTTAYALHLAESSQTPDADPTRGTFTLGAEASLSTAGLIVDDRAGVAGAGETPLVTGGGSISIAGYTVDLQSGSAIDVSGGVALSTSGKATYGDGGSLSIAAGQDPAIASLLGGRLVFDATLSGYAGAKGGSLSVLAPFIQVGGASAAADTLWLSEDFFNEGGFASFTLKGLGAAPDEPEHYRPAVHIAPGAHIAPVVQSLRIAATPDAAGGVVLAPTVLSVSERTAASLTFGAVGVRDAFNNHRPDVNQGNALIARGDLVMGEGATIVTDPKGRVALSGDTVTVLGSIVAPGGSIAITGGKDSAALFAAGQDRALATVDLGPSSFLSTAGTTILTPDGRGYRTGSVLAGGTIAVAGNIVAEKGAQLDVSGASDVLDVAPASAGADTLSGNVTSGTTFVATRIDSDAGTITFKGEQELFLDATLRGAAGGSGAQGGTLAVSSGRYIAPASGESSTPLDVTLTVTQGGSTLPAGFAATGAGVVGAAVTEADGSALSGGHFAADTFSGSGLTALSLGGTVAFSGPVTIEAGRSLSVASGGVLHADAAVSLAAPYVALGTAFESPQLATEIAAAHTVDGQPFYFVPTYGAGTLDVSARLIDIGNLSLQNIGAARFTAADGDIRGDGTLDVRGAITMTAGQIYPPTQVSFTIAAYDDVSPEGEVRHEGSVTFASSGSRSLPLSAGGTLNVYASVIEQGGVLRAPFGSINLGWDGTGSTPVDLVTGSGLVQGAAITATRQLTLSSGGVTSVSGVDPVTGQAIVVPYGTNQNGTAWIDPSGTDITVAGLPGKTIRVSAANVFDEAGSTIDLTGGGDLYAYRWVSGVGGKTDILASSTSFAVLPAYEADYAPYAPFNASTTAVSRGTDPGYTNAGLSVGDRVYLDASSGLPAGYYTLLPARYALLPGAFLVTPKSGAANATGAVQPDGSTIVSGYRYNALDSARTGTPLTTLFEVASAAVVRARAQYDDSSANTVFAPAAGSASTSPRAIDAGHLVLSAQQSMTLLGQVAAQAATGGRGGLVDITGGSATDIRIVADVTPGDLAGSDGHTLLLDSSELSAFGAESLLIGGYRTLGSDGATVTVTADTLTLDNAGGKLSGADVILAANDTLTIAAGAALAQSGTLGGGAETLLLGDATGATSDGALVRVGSDAAATIVRSGVDPAAATATLVVDKGASVTGTSVILDSTFATSLDLDPSTTVSGTAVSLSSGQISLVLRQPAGSAVVPNTSGLVLTQQALQDLAAAKSLTFSSYSSIDVYGSGQVGSSSLQNLALHAGAIRGFDNGGGTATFAAGTIALDNGGGATGSSATDPLAGQLAFKAGTLLLGANQLAVDGYGSLSLSAPHGILAAGTGGLSTTGSLAIRTPVLTGATGADLTLSAVGALTLAGTGQATVTGGLGASLTLSGASVTNDTTIAAASGSVTLRATGENGDVAVGRNGTGRIDVSGTAQTFYDVVKYTDGGVITLIADDGSVALGSGARLSVAAQAAAGDAGSLVVRAAQGTFTFGGSLAGAGGKDGADGAFTLDVGHLGAVGAPASLAALERVLIAGGFTESQSLRIRRGDVVVDGTAQARDFALSADEGSITVQGLIDASGPTGGRIDLAAGGSVTLVSGGRLTVAGAAFDNAGNGGSVSLEAGAWRAAADGVFSVDREAFVDVRLGSTIDLSIDGNMGGTLHLRAPQTADHTDLQIRAVGGTVLNASSIVVDGNQVFDLSGTDGTITNTGTIESGGGRLAADADVQGSVKANGALFGGNAAAIAARLFADNPDLAGVASIRPGAEIVNPTGDLTLATNWDLSSYRFGDDLAPGVLTLRAAGDLVFAFKASLSDGFASAAWNATLAAAGTQSWSYRLVAGADFAAADFRRVLPLSGAGALAGGTGSVLIGRGADALPVNTGSTVSRQTIVPNYFQTIRTGTGDIDIYAGRDVQLLNSLATVYTAGTLAPEIENFDAPFLFYQSSTLGATQSPVYPAQYTVGGGHVVISAQRDIAHYLDDGSGNLIADSTRELPTNWLYRRGYIDPETGLYTASHANGEIASTSWWVDFSNFYEGVGALGGGDVSLTAGRDISNVDAVIPTNARMPKDLAPDAANLVELGGGDLAVRAGRDIDGGVYYVERGAGVLAAGGSIHTNATRAALTFDEIAADQVAGRTPAALTWLPTTLFTGGDSTFDVSAAGDLLLGPVANVFLLPQGINNSFYEKTYFTTYGADNAVTATSLTGSVTLKDDASGGAGSLASWYQNVLLYYANTGSFSQSQPWLRLVETDITPFLTAAALMPGTLRVAAFSGDINIVGSLTLAPAAKGTVDFAAAGSINGVQPNGVNVVTGATQWGSGIVNLSDADPSRLPGVASPLSLSAPASGVQGGVWNYTPVDLFAGIDQLLNESGSTTGDYAVIQTKQALHAAGLLHAGDTEPLRLYARDGDISGLTLYSAKAAQVSAGRDVTDIALYVQNVAADDVTVVSAGRDIVAYAPNSALRVAAQADGNELLSGGVQSTTTPGSGTPTAGDIQISGSGTLEVLAGRNIDLGVGPNNPDGTAVGITSIGNARNPYLPFEGADVVVGAGLASVASLDAAGLADLEAFYQTLRQAGRDHGDPESDGYGNYDAGFAAIEKMFPKTQVWAGDISLTSREIKTASGGDISLFAPGGKLTVGVDIAGNQAADQGILTAHGGDISIFTRDSVIVGTSRIFTLRGGDEIIWSSTGDIAAGASSKTVQSAPPTRVLIDPQSGDVKTDLAGLATGGGIGVLATVAGVPPGDVDLIAPAGTVDAGDAGIRSSGRVTIASLIVANAGNISGQSVVGAPAASVGPPPGLAAASNTSSAATGSSAEETEKQRRKRAAEAQEETPSIISVEVLGYGGAEVTRTETPGASVSPAGNVALLDR